jgi:hypothetical protein
VASFKESEGDPILIGFLNFYWCFIEGFTKVAWPLHDLTKKAVLFHFSKVELATFKKLKELITTAPVLMLSNLM